MPEQRKLITALFCDLVGSTELAGTLEPETLRSVVLRYFDTMRTSIESRGGSVEKFIGDAVMAVFGVPVVREDDAARAAAAALDMIAGLGELNAALEQDFGSTLAVRIGMNSGEVVTSGEVTDGTMVSGEVVNVAARLEEAAMPGSILLGPTTRTLLGTDALVEPVGALSLKGKRDPVPAFRLLGLAAGDAEGDRTHRRETAFVGRERERRQLTAAWAEVRDLGSGRLIRMVGEAGTGKTRLLREWIAEPAGQGALVGVGRCHSHGDTASLAPLADALRDILGDLPPTALPPDGPALRVLRGGLLHDGTPSPSADSTWTAVADVLAAAAANRPTVLVLDDLQWARPLLLDGVERLRKTLCGAPVLLICSERPDSADPSVVDLRLGPLPAADARRLAGLLASPGTDGTAFPEGIPDAVIDRAEGNPFHLEQLLAMVADGADPHDLPATVTAVLTARLDTLGPAERSFLDAAAVVGRRFRPSDVGLLLRTRAGEGELHAPDRTTAHQTCDGPAVPVPERLLDRGLVEPAPGTPAACQFSSGLLHEVTYRGLSKLRRAQWHERLAEVPRTGAALPAHHLEQAYVHRRELGLRDQHTDALRGRAAAALTTAGRHALARADLSWSSELHQRALTHAADDDPCRQQATQGLGETWLALGRTEEGGELLRSAMRTAAATGDRLAYAHARLQLASLDTEAEHGAAVSAARAGLATFRAHGDRLGLARAHVRIGQEQQLQGRHHTAAALLTTALDHAVAAGADPEQAMALGALGISLWHGPTPAEEAVRRCRALLARHGPGNAAALVTLNYPLANLLALSGHLDEARSCVATADRFAAGLGYAEMAGVGPLFAAGVEVLAAADQRAEELLRESVRQCADLGHPALLAAASRDLARFLLLHDERPPARLLAGDGTRLPPADAADHFGVCALVSAADGDARSARELAGRAVAEAAATDSPLTRGTAQLDLAHVHLAVGDAGQARSAADRAARVFAAKGHTVGRAAALRLAFRADELAGCREPVHGEVVAHRDRHTGAAGNAPDERGTP